MSATVAGARRVQRRHPLQSSDALGAASTHLGRHAVTLIVLLNKHLGLSHGKVAALLRDWFGLRVQPSGVTHALHRAARQATPTYDALREQVRGSPVVSLDDTSWRVAGALWWLWAFATGSTVVYAIQAGCGFAEAAAVLGADFDGVMGCGGWAPYPQFDQAAHQTSLAHLLRRCREITEAIRGRAGPARYTPCSNRRRRCATDSLRGDPRARGRRGARTPDHTTRRSPRRTRSRG